MFLNESFYSIAPMMGKTDSYFCHLINLINKNVTVYTEMMHAESILRTKVLENYKLLDNIESIVIQIAGNNPSRLSLAAEKAAKIGFKEININCGCPSKRVTAGNFGISLLLQPILVRDCVERIKTKTNKEISIKTRIGVDQYNSKEVLDNFLHELNKVEVKKYIIHARIALRKKFNTKDNLNVPSLNYERVYKLKRDFKKNKIIINGGFTHTDYRKNIIDNVDGIMIGREAYKNPWIFNKNINKKDIEMKKNIIIIYLNFLKENFSKYTFNKNALNHIQNAFNGHEGAKEWRKKVGKTIINKDLKYLLNYIECANINIL